MDCERLEAMSSSLKIMYPNIDSLVSSLLEFKDFLIRKKTDVVCLRETKLREKIKLKLFHTISVSSN